MTYAEFAARDEQTNDDECLEVVMRWHLAVDGDYTVWVDADGNKKADRFDFSPTTDRNATAMLVEEVAHRGSLEVTRFIERLGEATGGLHVHPIENTVSVTWWPIDVLLAAPSLVAWACCESCRGGAS